MTLHIFNTDKIKRIRMICPYHKKLEYGRRDDYYDGSYIFFDCGTKILQEYWTPPEKKKCDYCREYFSPIEMINHLRDYHN
jgi:hypothetical protein